MIRGLELKINIPPLQESKVGGGGVLILEGGRNSRCGYGMCNRAYGFSKTVYV